jgi:hypothetical protein
MYVEVTSVSHFANFTSITHLPLPLQHKDGHVQLTADIDHLFKLTAFACVVVQYIPGHSDDR